MVFPLALGVERVLGVLKRLMSNILSFVGPHVPILPDGFDFMSAGFCDTVRYACDFTSTARPPVMV